MNSLLLRDPGHVIHVSHRAGWSSENVRSGIYLSTHPISSVTFLMDSVPQEEWMQQMQIPQREETKTLWVGC